MRENKHFTSLDDIEKIFDYEDKVPRTRIIFFISVLIVLLLSFRLYQVQGNINIFFTFDKATIDFWINVSISILTSIIAALIFSYYYEIKENKKLLYIRGVAHKDLLKSIIYDLDNYEGRYREDETIQAKLYKYPQNDLKRNLFYRCEIKYRYKTQYEQPLVKFSLNRIQNTKNMEGFFGSSPKNLSTDYEFQWANDESDFGNGSEFIIDDDYWIDRVLINDITVDPKIEIYEGSIRRLLYTASFPDELRLKKKSFYELSYHVSFPVEKESIIRIKHEFPANKAEVSFDYTDLANDIIVYPMPLIGSAIAKKVESKRHPAYPESFINYKYTGWVMPKNGYVFAWWEKK